MAQSDYGKITVASLCHANEGAAPTSTEATEQQYFRQYSTSSPPDVTPICARGHHLRRLDTTITLPSLLPARSSTLDGPGLFTQLHCVGHLDTADDSNGTTNVIDTTEGALSHINVNETIEHLSKVHTSTVKHCNDSGKTTVFDPSAYPTMPDSTIAMHTYHGAGVRVQSMAQPTPTQSRQRVPRAARHPYTEQQKFFIMYQRIIGGLSWPEIEDKFASFFDIRTRDGLTSVYYRLRKDWGMEEVLKANCHAANDVGKVEERAAHFQKDFLEKLGYFG